MFRQNTPAQLAKWLDEYRARHICCYASWAPDPDRPGEAMFKPNTYCDCKYGGPEERTVTLQGKEYPVSSEQTGCPEMREIIEELWRLDGLLK